MKAKTKVKKIKKGAILIDPAKCVACKSCELACAIEHSQSKKLMMAICEDPLSKPRVSIEFVAGLTVHQQCRHCKDAPCIKICPTKAIKRKEKNDPVLIDQKLCIGCKKCIPVCPFNAIRMDTIRKKAIKCDLCFERTKRGEYPACVVACPTGALEFKSLDEISDDKCKDYLVKFKKGNRGTKCPE